MESRAHSASREPWLQAERAALRRDVAAVVQKMKRLREYSQLVHGLDGLDENVGGFAGSASDIQVARNSCELCELDESDCDFAAVVT